MKVNGWTILFLLAIAFIAWREFTRVDPDRTIIIQDTLVAGDEVPYFISFPAYILKPYKVELPPDTFLQQVDSAAILERCMEIARSYYGTFFYDPVLIDDSSAYLRLLARTHKNKLMIDSLEFQNHRPAIIRREIHHYYDEKVNLYGGLGVGRNPQEFDVTGNVLVTFPKGWGLQGTYGLMTKDIYFTAYYRFKGRKVRPPKIR